MFMEYIINKERTQEIVVAVKLPWMIVIEVLIASY